MPSEAVEAQRMRLLAIPVSALVDVLLAFDQLHGLHPGRGRHRARAGVCAGASNIVELVVYGGSGMDTMHRDYRFGLGRCF
jgi:hypothetical protein